MPSIYLPQIIERSARGERSHDVFSRLLMDRVGCFLLAAGHPGRRRSLPHARIMMHQPSQMGGGGTAADVEILAKEVLHLRATTFGLLARHTGQPLERIERDFDRDKYMSAPEAQRYGLIDCVIDAPGHLIGESAQRMTVG